MKQQHCKALLLEKIGLFLDAIQNSTTFLNSDDIDNLQKCVLALFQFHQSYIDGWKALIHSLNPTGSLDEEIELENLRKKYDLFLKELEHASNFPEGSSKAPTI